MGRFATLLLEDDRGLIRVTLNRPERRNAFDGEMVTELTAVFAQVARDQPVRGVVLTGSGAVFCAGADLRWMSPDSPLSERQAQEDAERLVRMYRAIDECPCPVIGRVQGPAFGGGVGLVAVCDAVVTTQSVTFALSEVRLGLIPAVISPFLLRKAGESFVRRYCLTGESFSASEAKHHHLVHEVVDTDQLDPRTEEFANAILRLAPGAARQAKALLRRILTLPDDARWRVCVEANAHARLSDEAKEGLRAFLDKRPPSWMSDQPSPTGPRRDS